MNIYIYIYLNSLRGVSVLHKDFGMMDRHNFSYYLPTWRMQNKIFQTHTHCNCNHGFVDVVDLCLSIFWGGTPVVDVFFSSLH